MRKRRIPGMLPEPSDPCFGTAADLAELGPDETLAAMRADFAGAHKRFDQFRGWELGAELACMRRPVKFRGSRAEKGDLVLSVRGQGEFAKVYIPRVGHHCMVSPADLQEVSQ